jgi:hypothetical protein
LGDYFLGHLPFGLQAAVRGLVHRLELLLASAFFGERGVVAAIPTGRAGEVGGEDHPSQDAQAQEARRESEELAHRQLLQQAPEGVPEKARDGRRSAFPGANSRASAQTERRGVASQVA